MVDEKEPKITEGTLGKEVSLPTFDFEKMKAQELVAKIIEAKFVEVEISGEKGPEVANYLELRLLPQGAEKSFSFRVKPSERKKSLWGVFLKGLQDCGIKIKSEQDLVGHTFRFGRQDISFGKFFTKEDFLVPKEMVE